MNKLVYIYWANDEMLVDFCKKHHDFLQFTAAFTVWMSTTVETLCNA